MKRLLQILVVLFSFSGAAQAASWTFYFNAEFSGGEPPIDNPPWMAATFEDLEASNSVRLTLDAAGLTAQENVVGAYFNLDPLLSPDLLSFAYLASSTGPQATAITQGVDCCKADGDGRYDFRFSFPTGSGFDANETVIYDISYSGAGVMNASSFNYLSTPAGGNGPFVAAAHIQNTGFDSSGSGWVTYVMAAVPEPASWFTMLAGLLALGGLRARRT